MQATYDEILAEEARRQEQAAQRKSSSPISAFFRGAGSGGTLGFSDEITGAALAPILKGIRPDLFGSQSMGDLYKEARDTVRQQDKQASQDHPYTTFAGNVAGSMGLPFPANNLKQAVALSGLYGMGYGLGGSEANTMQGLSNDTIKSGGLGALMGGGIYGTGQVLGKTINALRGGTIDPAKQAIIDAGAKHDVPVFAPDVLPESTLAQGAAQGLEEVPLLGIRGDRAVQNQKALSAAQRVTADAQKQMLGTEFQGIDDLQRAVQKGGPRAEAAKQLINDINSSGDDWQKIIETSGNLSLFNKKLAADQKYKLVEGLASKYGPVPLQDTSSALQDAIKGAAGSVLPDKQLIGTLNTLRDNLGKGELGYNQLRQARSDIGGIISDAYKGKNAAVGTQGAAALQSVKDAITHDMDAFAQKNGPELSNAWRAADSYYKVNVAPYKDAQLANALKGAAPDEIFSKFVTTGGIEGGKGTSRAERLYNALDNKGQAAVRYGMVNNAFQKAYNVDRGSFSPAAFASELDRTAAAKGVFFKGEGKAEIDGFKNLMRHVERSNVAINKPETGVKNVPVLLSALAGGGLYAAPVETAAVGASTYATKLLLTTRTGRNWLLAASKLKVGSPGMQKIADQFANAALLSGTKTGLDKMRPDTQDNSAVHTVTYDDYLKELQRRGM